jgi:hypothetical protein
VLILLLAPLGESLRFVVSPWPRADVAGAAEYILAHRQADEGVLANHWEFAYYLRYQANSFHWLGCDLHGHEQRVWVALTAPDENGRRQFLTSLAQQGRIVEQKEFTYTSVALIDLNFEPVRELVCAEQPAIEE